MPAAGLARPVRPVKLAPPVLPRDTVRRRRLLARLDAAATAPLTFVVGAAGFGKTTLLASWAATAPLPVGWVALDVGDDDALAVAIRIDAALERLCPGVLDPVRALLRRSGSVDPVRLGEAMADALTALEADVALVLDDAHHVAGSAATMLDALLAYPPPRFHLVLAGRARPALGQLPRLRRQGLVEEVGERELRFTDEEAGRLLAPLLPAARAVAETARIRATVDGWPAGVRIAWLRLREARDAGTAPLLPPDGFGGWLDDDLANDLLGHLPPAALALLTRAAIAERVCAGLIDALFDPPRAGSQGVLDDLAQDHPFVFRLPGEPPWYRVHQLLRDALLARLHREVGEAGIARLNRRAADWCAAAGDVEGAVGHALAAGDEERAAELVESSAFRTPEAGRWESVVPWMRRLPAALRAQRPGLLLVEANLLSEEGLLGPAERLLDMAEALLVAGPVVSHAGAGLQQEAAALRCFCAVARGEESDALGLADALLADSGASANARHLAYPARALALQARGDGVAAAADLENALARAPTLPPVEAFGVLSALTVVHLRDGAVAAAERAAQRLAQAFAADPGSYGARCAGMLLGLLQYERDDVTSAEQTLRTAVAPAAEVGPLVEHDATLALALVLRADGKRKAARDLASRFVATLANRGDTPWLATAASFEARLALLDGEADTALRWLAEAERAERPQPFSLVEHEGLTRALVLLARNTPGDHERAQDELAALRRRGEAGHDRWLLGRVLAAEAYHRHAVGEPGAAEALALPLADERLGLRRRLVDLGPDMAGLLASVDAPASLVRLAVDAAAPVGPANDADRPPAPPEPVGGRLTVRERHVLAGLGERLSNREIAERLGVSPETVKRHAASLYRKLGVSSRREAVRIAYDGDRSSS